MKTTAWDAATGTVTVPARSVAVLVDEQAPPAVATVVIAAPNKAVRRRPAPPVKVAGTVVAADGTAPVGTVTILDGGEVIATTQVAAGGRGRFDVKLPKLGAGVHVLTVAFDGGEGYADSQSVPIVIVLW